MERPVEGTEVNRCHAKNRSVSEKSQEWRNRIRIEGNTVGMEIEVSGIRSEQVRMGGDDG